VCPPVPGRGDPVARPVWDAIPPFIPNHVSPSLMALEYGTVIADMNVHFRKTVEYWKEGSKYDLGVARALFKSRKYPYALFIGHLSVEKMLKALVVAHTRQHAPFTHSLAVLADKTGLSIPPEIKNKLARFMEYYQEGRYPEEQKNFYRRCTKSFAEFGLKEIEEVLRWCRRKFAAR